MLNGEQNADRLVNLKQQKPSVATNSFLDIH